MKRTELGRALMVAAGAAGWATVVGLALSSGCASIVGADDYKVGDGMGTGAGGSTGAGCGTLWTRDDAPCEACMERQCCIQLRACAPNTSCATLLECASANCVNDMTVSCYQNFC